MNWNWLDPWLREAPMAWVGAVLFLAMCAAGALGYWLRRRHDSGRGVQGEESESQHGYLFSAVVGLLALLTGFTFSLAIERFDARRVLVLQEANAIGTTYLRTQLMVEPHRSRISDLLVRYTDNRIELAKVAPGDSRGPGLLARNDALIADLWSGTVGAWDSIKGYDFSSAYVDTMNNLIDLDAARKAARNARVPNKVFGVLFVYLIVTAAVLGYVMTGARGRLASGFLMVLLLMSLLLILDIDRPVGGGIVEAQRPMEQLQKFLKSHPPGSFDRWKAPTAALPAAVTR